MAMNASPSNRKAKSLQNEKKFEALEFQLPDSGASFMNDNAWISWIIPIALIDISDRKVIGKVLVSIYMPDKLLEISNCLSMKINNFGYLKSFEKFSRFLIIF
jgi:hypothetical protein